MNYYWGNFLKDRDSMIRLGGFPCWYFLGFTVEEGRPVQHAQRHGAVVPVFKIFKNRNRGYSAPFLLPSTRPEGSVPPSTAPHCIGGETSHMHAYVTHVSKAATLPRYASLDPSLEKAGDRANRSPGVKQA